MEEYEVDLRDYLRVIWEHKWVVLGVFIAAIIAVAVFSFTLPDEYEASALLQWSPNPPLQSQWLLSSIQQLTQPVMNIPPADLQGISAEEAVEFIKALIDVRGHPDLKFEVKLLGNFRENSISSGGFISLKFKGPLPPQRLKELLTRQVDSLQAFLSQQIREDLQQRTIALDKQRKFFEEQRSQLLEGLQTWVTERLKSLSQRRQLLLKQLENLLNPEGKGEAPQGLIAEHYYAILISQLQAIENELIHLQGQQESPWGLIQTNSGLGNRLAEIDRSLEQLNLLKREYQRLLDAHWTPVRLVKEPEASLRPIGPPRKLNITIAGLLGLFLGIMLAFFIHYLQGEPPNKAVESRTERG